MVQLDWATGEILKALDANQLAENTLVIFSSDNGPVYDDGYEDGTTVRTSTQEVDRGHDASGPYRGGKYQIYEGGTRVPFIVKWPGQIQPGKSDAMVSQIDFIASFASMLEIPLETDQAIDSRKCLPALLGKSDTGHEFIIEEALRSVALRQGAWKYIQKQGRKQKQNTPVGELYNLASDVGEQSDVAAAHPSQAKRLQETLKMLIDANDGIRNLSAQ